MLEGFGDKGDVLKLRRQMRFHGARDKDERYAFYLQNPRDLISLSVGHIDIEQRKMKGLVNDCFRFLDR